MAIVILCINTKGGSGKTYTSTQCLSAWFLHNKQEITINNFDDVNKGGLKLSNSTISVKDIDFGELSNLYPHIEKILLDVSTNRLIDVGGNKTSQHFMDNIDRLPSVSLLDLIVIPITPGISECLGAIDTYNNLIKVGLDPKKIMFVFTRTIGNSLDIRNNFNMSSYFDFLSFISKPDVCVSDDQIIVLPNTITAIESSRKEMIIYEMYLGSKKVIKIINTELMVLIKRLKSSEDKNERLDLEREVSILNNARLGYKDSIPYATEVLIPQFAKINKILGASHS